jgi:two-component system NarL family response regulator
LYALIIDDHPLYRTAIARLVDSLRAKVPMTLIEVASAEDGLSAAAELKEIRLVVLDLMLPGLNGIAAISAIRQACPDACLVLVSATENRAQIIEGLQAGANVFVSKGAPTERMADTIRRGIDGELTLPEWLTTAGVTVSDLVSERAFTPRQTQVLRHVAAGLSNKEISERMHLAEVTVKMHIGSIFRFLNVNNRTKAVAEARHRGLLAP